MKNAGIKFSCRASELKDALGKHCDFKKVEIEGGEDVVRAVESLLAAGNIVFVDVINNECEFDGEIGSEGGGGVIITVGSVSTAYAGERGFHTEEDKECFTLKKFLEGVKKLQKMIFGE